MKKFIQFLLLAALSFAALADDIDDPAASPGYYTVPSTTSPAAADDADADEEDTGTAAARDDADEDFFEDSDDVMVEVSDPLEGINRAMFWFNDKLYFYFLKPVARVYRVVPEPVRESVQNFFSNIDTPTRLVNSALQLKFKDAGGELVRFVVNTTIGIGGFFDPARHWMGLEKKDEDTGQTFGRYGIGPGPYLVLPVLGPSNFRDGIGLIGDTALDPIYQELEDGEYYWTKFFDAVNDISLDKDTYESIKRDNLDPYLFVRDAYMQHRAGKIKK